MAREQLRRARVNLLAGKFNQELASRHAVKIENMSTFIPVRNLATCQIDPEHLRGSQSALAFRPNQFTRRPITNPLLQMGSQIGMQWQMVRAPALGVLGFNG